MTAGRIFYVIGASGVGKDSLMVYARRVLNGGGVLFAHRYITRPLVGNSENFIALSPAEFAERRAAGCFALHWESHGFGYGIGIEIDLWRERGLSVVVNGSRAYLDRARRRYADLVPVLIRATPEHRQERLLARHRENTAAMAERLARGGLDADVLEAPGLVILDNDGPLEVAGERLVNLLKRESGGCHVIA